MAQETLEDLTFAFDGGPTLNFAEGSVSVHSALATAGKRPGPCEEQLALTAGGMPQLPSSSRARPASTAARWSTCMLWSTRPWTRSQTVGGPRGLHLHADQAPSPASRRGLQEKGQGPGSRQGWGCQRGR